MDFELVGRSGYLSKTSGISWDDCLQQTPVVETTGALRAGLRYWIEYKPGPVQNWGVYRAFQAFNTSVFGDLKASIRSATLVLPLEAVKNDSNWLVGVRVMDADGWGDDLDAGDWDINEGTRIALFDGPAQSGIITVAVDPDLINRFGLTYFRVNAHNDANPLDPPTDETYIDIGRGAILVAETGNVNDDVCQNIADVLSSVSYTQLDGVTIRGRLLPVLKSIPEIQVGWEGTDTDLKSGVQVITASILYIQSSLAGPSAAEPSSIDESPRIMADIIRRILIDDADCNGYCSGLIDVTETLAGELQWRDNWYQGAIVTVRYERPIAHFDPSKEPFS